MKHYLLILTSMALSSSLCLRTEAVLIQVTGCFNASQTLDTAGLNTFDPLLNQPFTFVFTYDASVADSDDSDNYAVYTHDLPSHQCQLTSTAVSATDTQYDLVVTRSPNPPSYSLYSYAAGPPPSGLTSPDYNELYYSFGYSHPVSESAVEFLNTGLAYDPLPETPFFLGESTTGAQFYFELSTTSPIDGSGNPPTSNQLLYGSVSSIIVLSGSSNVAIRSFTYDPLNNQFDLSIAGQPNTVYILVEADDMDFSNPDQSPIPLTGASASVGSLDGNTIVTDGDGNATVETVDLGSPKKDRTFLRAETP